MMNILIETNGLTKNYGEVIALQNFTIQIERGAIGLLGPNGAGKSTLIKLLLGLIPTTSGTATVFSSDIQRDGLKIRQRVGYMPEHDCLLPDLSAVSFLSYLGQLSGLAPHDAMQRAHEALYYVKIGDERYRNISTYSQGMKQKVKLAQALVHDPELILLDEPTTGLDPTGRREMLDLIDGIVHKQGKNILFSSHILTDIEQICDKVIIMNHGKLLAVDNLQNLLFEKEPDLVVRIKGDTKLFMDKLEQSGLNPNKQRNEIVIKYAPDITEKVIDIAVSTGVQLRRLDRSKHTLEELFIKLIDTDDVEQPINKI